jgi:hypothetical protein
MEGEGTSKRMTFRTTVPAAVAEGVSRLGATRSRRFSAVAQVGKPGIGESYRKSGVEPRIFAHQLTCPSVWNPSIGTSGALLLTRPLPSKVYSAAVVGVEAFEVEIEVHAGLVTPIRSRSWVCRSARHVLKAKPASRGVPAVPTTCRSQNKYGENPRRDLALGPRK